MTGARHLPTAADWQSSGCLDAGTAGQPAPATGCSQTLRQSGRRSCGLRGGKQCGQRLRCIAVCARQKCPSLRHDMGKTTCLVHGHEQMRAQLRQELSAVHGQMEAEPRGRGARSCKGWRPQPRPKAETGHFETLARQIGPTAAARAGVENSERPLLRKGVTIERPCLTQNFDPSMHLPWVAARDDA